MTAEAGECIGVVEQMQDGRRDALAALHLLELELVAPGDQRPPEKLVRCDDDENHRDESPGDRDAVARIGGGLEIRAKAGKAEVARAEVKHLARHQKEPRARDRHDRVPDKPDGGVGQLQLKQPLHARKTVDAGRFHQLLGDALERRVEAERHVPHRAREDQDDRSHLNPKLAGRKERDHGEHDGRQKAQHGDRLQDVENRNHHLFGAPVVRRDVAVGDCEEQAEQVGETDAHDGVEGVVRQRTRTQRDDDLGLGAACPEHRDPNDGIKTGKANRGDAEVEEEGPAAFQHLGASERLPRLQPAEPVGKVDHASISSSVRLLESAAVSWNAASPAE